MKNCIRCDCGWGKMEKYNLFKEVTVQYCSHIKSICLWTVNKNKMLLIIIPAFEKHWNTLPMF